MTDTLNTDWTTAQPMLSVDDFAALPHTPQTRAIRTALKEGRVTGAVWDQHANGGRGRWQIPADAVVQPRAGTTVQRATPAAAAPATTSPDAAAADVLARPRLVEILDRSPAYLPVDDAARLLGVPATRIREHPELFGAQPLGYRESLLVPQSIIRDLAGLR